MTKDPLKIKAATARYWRKKKIQKYGFDPGDLRGKHRNHAKGASHPRWNGGRAVHQDGYIKIQVGKGHSLADPVGYAYKHLLVWVTSGNSPPNGDQLLHHINGDKTDNRLENLQLVSRSEHAKMHDLQRGRDALGRFPPKDFLIDTVASLK